MWFLKQGWVVLWIAWCGLAASPAWAQEKGNREIRPVSQMSGTVISALESGKQILSSGDRIIVALAMKIEVKTGDHLEIFQPLTQGPMESPEPFLQRTGLAVFLEKIDEKRILCIIDHSAKEVSVGDWVYLVPSP